MLYSFDIFDTLIMRRIATSQGIFALMKSSIQKYYPDINTRLCGDFYELRTAAETSANAEVCRKSLESTTLEGIYSQLKAMTALNDEDIKLLMELECRTECENVCPVYENINYLKDIAKEGNAVVLISDMYLHKQQIRNMLMQFDEIFADIPIYVSSDCMANKITGNLYRRVRYDRRVRYSEWVHIGDNPVADVMTPLSLGIDARLYDSVKLLDCEKELLKGRENHPLVQMFIGCAKMNRVKRDNTVAAKLGSTYGAGIIMQYAAWTLSLCNCLNIRDIYYVARDGYVILKAAVILNKCKQYELNLNYIYGSRQPWKITAIGDADTYNVREYLESVTTNGGCSLSDIAKSLGISAGELCSLPEMEELSGIDISEKIIWEDYNGGILFEKFEGSEALKEKLVDNNCERSLRTEAYLKQELSKAGERVAFVDVFGTGRTQSIIASFIKNKLGINVTSLFYSRLYDIDTHNELLSCISSDVHKSTVMEALTRSLQGRTVDYRVADEDKSDKHKIIPVQADEDTKLLEEYGYGEYLDTVLQTIEDFTAAAGDYDENAVYSIGNFYYKYLCEEEKGEMLEYIQKQPISNNFHGRETVTEFAPVITDAMIKERREKGFMSLDSSCFYFSLKRCSEDQLKRIEDSVAEYAAKQSLEAAAHWRKKLESPHEYRLSVKPSGRIALYGAGDVGTSIYNQLTVQGDTADIEIVAWVDQRFTSKDGIKDCPANIKSYDFDTVIICIRDKEIAADVMCDLMDMGVDSDKIYHEEYELIFV